MITVRNDHVILCVLDGLAVISVDFGNEYMKIAIVKVSTSCKHVHLCMNYVKARTVITAQL